MQAKQSTGGNYMKDNVIQLTKDFRQKVEKHFVYLGKMSSYGEVEEREAVGIAFQRDGSSQFRMKLWMFHKTPYFLIPAKDDRTKYIVYAVDDHPQNKELKSFWNKVGVANLCGNYLKVKLYLLQEDLFLSLFSSNQPNNYQEAS